MIDCELEEWTPLDNEKHVIPREQYRRNDRTIKNEREQRERLAKRARTSKVNEERVKDNMRKARIEINTRRNSRQQHLAKLRSDNESDQN